MRLPALHACHSAKDDGNTCSDAVADLEIKGEEVKGKN
jgi:hypothetical protein